MSSWQKSTDQSQQPGSVFNRLSGINTNNASSNAVWPQNSGNNRGRPVWGSQGGRGGQRPHTDQRNAGQGGFGSTQNQNQGGMSRSTNRFAALGNAGGWNNTEGSHSGVQRQQGDRRQDWRLVVKDDMTNEQPMWPYTCYAHERNGPNDILGDVSFEEVRWAEQQALASGTNASILVSQFQRAVAERQQQFQKMLKSPRPPSQGGPPVAPVVFPLPTRQDQMPASPATPFTEVVSVFGQQSKFPSYGPTANLRGLQAAIRSSPNCNIQLSSKQSPTTAFHSLWPCNNRSSWAAHGWGGCHDEFGANLITTWDGSGQYCLGSASI
eukprot:jgi/Botrbrau1/5295/Bobra.0391s0016.3